MPEWTGTWAGGRTYQREDGRTVYVLRKTRGGVAYQHVLRGVEGEAAAKAELALFDRDPTTYQPPKLAHEEKAEAKEADEAKAVTLTVEAGAGYLSSALKDRDPRYRKDSMKYLAAWAAALNGRDLRKVTPQEMLKILGTWETAERNRIQVIKAFCNWLVKKGRLDPAENPTRSMTVPPPRPEKNLREKGFEMVFVETLYSGIEIQAVRDFLCLKAKLGLHETEIRRIAAGEVVLTPVDHAEIKGTLKFIHKRGTPHLVSVDAQTWAAAKRTAKLGKDVPTDFKVRHALGTAAEKLGLLTRDPKSKSKRPAPVNLSEIRHSFVAWSLSDGEAITIGGKGVPLALVSSVLGHTNTVTTKKFYDVTKIPTMIRLPIRLVHVSDPPIQAEAQAA